MHAWSNTAMQHEDLPTNNHEQDANTSQKEPSFLEGTTVWRPTLGVL